MMNLSTPGIYFQTFTQKQPDTLLVRSDIAALFGYARRGPVGIPIQIHSWRHYLSVFGIPYDQGYLAPAVKGFFENGGSACYVVRVADDSAQAASLRIASDSGSGYFWQLTASHLLSGTANGSSEGRGSDVTQRLVAGFQSVAHLKRADNPGQWGNQLSVSIERQAISNTQTVPGVIERGFVTQVESITGLAAHSIVELYQESADNTSFISQTAIIERVDLLTQEVYWKQSLKSDMNFDLSRPIRLQSIEYAVMVMEDNRIVERFNALSLHPDHDRFLISVINSESLYVQASHHIPEAMDESVLVKTAYRLPVLFNQPLRAGTDGLTGISAQHYLSAIAGLEKVDDIGILAAPDLVLAASPAAPEEPFFPVRSFSCARQLEAPPEGHLTGRVMAYLEAKAESGEESDSAMPIAGVIVTYAAGGKQARTDAEGYFSFSPIETGLLTLRFEKSGFETVEQLTLVQETASDINFYLTPILFPPTFIDNDIIQVQQAMASHGANFYRFALLDAPRPDMKLDQIRGWRQKLGDMAFAALYYPWLGLPPDVNGRGAGSLNWVPPSGHIAGIMAHTDRSEGVHRAPANFNLRNVKRLSVEVNESHHGILNSEGINAIRSFAGRGLVPYGARTLSSDAQWLYLNVRRLISIIEKTLEKTLQWAVFEGNTTLLRQAVSHTITSLLNRLWRQGALAGNRVEGAYAVKCNEDNNPPAVRDAGQLVVEVAVAPVIPFEFIIFKLGKTMEAIEVTE